MERPQVHVLLLSVFILDILYRVDGAAITCPSINRYRTFDGSCNNLNDPSRGQAGTAQKRFTDKTGSPMVDYEDGIDEPRGGIQSRLPSPRLISSTISDATDGPKDQADNSRSGMNMAFGQLLAHDIIKTELHTGIDCCDKNGPNYNNSNVCFTFDIPNGDGRFTPGCKSFNRATKATSGTNLPAYREHSNLISSYIDAGFLYGSSETEVLALRDGDSYLMKTGDHNLLPLHSGGGCVKFHGQCPLVGEDRVAEAPNLGINHMLWVREHNRIAKILDDLNPPNITYDSIENGTFFQSTREDIIFQETRRIIIAIVQHITYNHYLPSILDDDTMRNYNLYSKTSGYDEVYDPSIDVSIRNGFGTAVFRFGHSQIMPDQSLLHADFQTMNVTNLEDNLKNPQMYLVDNGTNVNNLARWLMFMPARQIDNYGVDGVRENLFIHTDAPGEDLFSLNIQRGRDQGTPGFNRWRQLCGLSTMTFNDFGNHSTKLASVYNSSDDIDFFIGGLLESRSDGRLGPTFACVLAKQFQLFKTGDRFWYERSDYNFAFTSAQVKTIKNGANLAKIYCRNFGLNRMHKDIFMSSPDASLLENCDDLPDIDLSLWKIDSKGSNISQKYSILTIVIFILWTL